MADVLIVCVREDEAQAKSLADMFEAAGFSVGGAPSSDAALRSSGAGVVVWSQASIRSRPFLDAAQRVINAGKGVLACLIEAPPPESVNNSPAFDLTAWSGDANDPSLDPLFFAIDRMVNTARASVGAPAAEYERPSARATPASAPSYSRQRTPPQSDEPQIALPPGFQIRSNSRRASQQQPPPPPANEDLLGDEAEHWRAIRHSKDATDFLDYLARYGPEGAFAELAEFRLKQLEGGANQSSLRDAARAASSEPTRNYDAPPRRRSEPARSYEPPPQRRPDPPPRRPDPPPVRLDPPPRREASYERDYHPPIDNRDVPKREGGFLRMLIVLVLLGGGAVAAGIYFGVGDRLQSMTSPPAQTQDVASQPIVGEPASAPLTGSDTGSLNGGNDIPAAQVVNEVGASPPPTRQQRQSQPANNNNNRNQPQRVAANDPVNAAAVPQTSWGAPNTSPTQAGGSPVSLLPGAQQPSQSAPLQQQQTASFSPPPIVATTVASGPAPSVMWAQRPSADRLTATYPHNALRDSTPGSASLDCVVRSDLGVTCAVASESPAGAGFGRAALNAVAYYRSRPTLSDGSSAVGARTHLTISFRAPPR